MRAADGGIDLDALRQDGARNPDGTFAKGNMVRLTTGERTPRLFALPDIAAAHQERVDAITTDLGGPTELSTTQAALVCELARLQLITASLGADVIGKGPLTAKGNRRAALSAYLNVLDRQQKLSDLLGLRRVPKSPISNLDAYLTGETR
jgi:hypothetical protein